MTEYDNSIEDLENVENPAPKTFADWVIGISVLTFLLCVVLFSLFSIYRTYRFHDHADLVRLYIQTDQSIADKVGGIENMSDFKSYKLDNDGYRIAQGKIFGRTATLKAEFSIGCGDNDNSFYKGACVLYEARLKANDNDGTVKTLTLTDNWLLAFK